MASLAQYLTTISSAHLKRIIAVLPQFDLHDDTHSERVADNISRLIGDEHLERLSSSDLFLLCTAAHLHDCGMAPAEFELKALEAVHSNRFDSYTQAKKYIEAHKEDIYKQFEGEVSKWLFSPESEFTLIDQLASAMMEYQEFRDGYADNHDSLHNFIRYTHHKRAERYIRNAEHVFAEKLDGNWGKRLAKDLAAI